MKYIDIMLVKAQVNDGKLITKIDRFDNILLEDTLSGEAAKIGKLPEGYSFHRKGKWLPDYETFFDYNERETAPIQTGWKCSECSWCSSSRYNWCICGADMRASNKPSKEMQELLEVL